MQVGSYTHDDPVMVRYRERRLAALDVLKLHGSMTIPNWREKVELLAPCFDVDTDTMWVAATSLISDGTVRYSIRENVVSS